jgi:polyisoprenoid-binding protein YceI
MKSFGMMKLAAAIVLAAGAGSLSAQTAWKIDPAHSEAGFGIKHMAISTVHGTFHGIAGTVALDDKNLTKSSVEATIDITTIDTGVAQRDGHLKSPDFFDAAKFPTMDFKSTSVTKTGDHYNVAGLLTIHGVTKPVVLALETPAAAQSPDGKSLHRGFTATTTINRQDFGLTWNGTLKSCDSVLGNDVKIELNIEAVQQ